MPIRHRAHFIPGAFAAAAKKPHFRDSSFDDFCGQLEDVTADGIADLDRGGSTGQLSGIARVAKMIENGFAEHLCKYGKRSPVAATRQE